MNKDIISLYSGEQSGGELPYFVGKQYGSGWLKTIGRFALPFLKRLGGVAMKTADDVINNDTKIFPSLKTHAMSEVNNFLTDGNNRRECEPKVGGSIKSLNKRRKPAHSYINKRRKTTGTIFHK